MKFRFSAPAWTTVKSLQRIMPRRTEPPWGERRRLRRLAIAWWIFLLDCRFHTMQLKPMAAVVAAPRARRPRSGADKPLGRMACVPLFCLCVCAGRDTGGQVHGPLASTRSVVVMRSGPQSKRSSLRKACWPLVPVWWLARRRGGAGGQAPSLEVLSRASPVTWERSQTAKVNRSPVPQEKTF